MVQENDENVQTILRGVGRYNERDIDGFLECGHPDVEWDSAFAALDGGSYKGLDAVRGYFEEIAASWDVFELRPLDCQAVGDKVLLAIEVYGKGRSSGVEIRTPAWIVFWMREGKADRGKTFLDRSDALEAVGLRE